MPFDSSWLTGTSILSDRLCTTNLHPFASANDLFCIGSKASMSDCTIAFFGKVLGDGGTATRRWRFGGRWRQPFGQTRQHRKDSIGFLFVACPRKDCEFPIFSTSSTRFLLPLKSSPKDNQEHAAEDKNADFEDRKMLLLLLCLGRTCRRLSRGRRGTVWCLLGLRSSGR